MSKDTTMSIRIILAVFAAALFAGCANTKSATEADFGNSMASLVKAQTANPATVANPSTEPVTGVDPDYATNVIDAMREDVAKPAEVKQPIEIRVGGQGGT
jgi:type IV pilus biogenesis protein CpaD/CtpE